jgi:hypothetical protein
MPAFFYELLISNNPMKPLAWKTQSATCFALGSRRISFFAIFTYFIFTYKFSAFRWANSTTVSTPRFFQ